MITEKQMILPVGYVAVPQLEYDFAAHDRTLKSNTLSILKARVISVWRANDGNKYLSTINCQELADLMGFDLPEIEEDLDD